MANEFVINKGLIVDGDVSVNGTASGNDGVNSNDFITKGQLDASIAAGDLQQVTDLGSTTTNSISITDGSLYISGNVGIGTTSPGGKLEVVGDSYFSYGDASGDDLMLNRNLMVQV